MAGTVTVFRDQIIPKNLVFVSYLILLVGALADYRPAFLLINLMQDRQ
jgi:hypothetical protein